MQCLLGATNVTTAGRDYTARVMQRRTLTMRQADINGVYEYGCKLFRKRMECAIMMKVAEQLKVESKKK